jgi:hypothetical protein
MHLHRLMVVATPSICASEWMYLRQQKEQCYNEQKNTGHGYKITLSTIIKALHSNHAFTLVANPACNLSVPR